LPSGRRNSRNPRNRVYTGRSNVRGKQVCVNPAKGRVKKRESGTLKKSPVKGGVGGKRGRKDFGGKFALKKKSAHQLKKLCLRRTSFFGVESSSRKTGGGTPVRVCGRVYGGKNRVTKGEQTKPAQKVRFKYQREVGRVLRAWWTGRCTESKWDRADIDLTDQMHGARLLSKKTQQRGVESGGEKKRGREAPAI